MRIPKDLQNYPPCRQCCGLIWRKSLFGVHSIGDTMVFQAIWLVRFNTTIELTMRSFSQAHRIGLLEKPPFSVLLIKRRMRSTTRSRKQLWVYESATSLDEVHGKNLARVTGLHTLLVLNVLKMLEATSFEKINAVKKWTGMQNKQCNGIRWWK